MATIVIGGSNRGVGKTALVCGLIAALRGYRWIAVKISSHDHGESAPIWEETEPGQGTDTARFLAAGAARAYLVTASGQNLTDLLTRLTARVDHDANLIFESNQVLEALKPDLCLLVQGGTDYGEPKPSFSRVAGFADAMVTRSGDAGANEQSHLDEDADARPCFSLASFDRIPPEILAWLRQKLPAEQA